MDWRYSYMWLCFQMEIFRMETRWVRQTLRRTCPLRCPSLCSMSWSSLFTITRSVFLSWITTMNQSLLCTPLHLQSDIFDNRFLVHRPSSGYGSVLLTHGLPQACKSTIESTITVLLIYFLLLRWKYFWYVKPLNLICLINNALLNQSSGLSFWMWELLVNANKCL